MSTSPSTPPSPRNGHRRPGAIRSLVRSLSDLVERSEFAKWAGFTFGGKRDVYEALGYDRRITTEMYWDRYDRGGIAQRIVKAFPLATWAGGASIVEGLDSETTPTDFDKTVGDLFTRMDLWGRFTRADIQAGIGRYGVLFIGAPGKLDTELPMMTGPGDILYFTPLGEDRAKIGDKDKGTESPRFGLPLTYSLKLSDNTDTVVHWTRVIHIVDDPLENDLLGSPRLRAPWNYLDDLEKVVGGGAEAAWKRMNPGMQIDIDPEIEMDKAAEDKLSAELDEYEHGQRRTMRTRGTKVNLLAANVAAFGQNADTIVELISATTGIPQRILMGSERGQLASEQDRSNYADRIADRRRIVATPAVYQLVNRLIIKGVLPRPKGFGQEDLRLMVSPLRALGPVPSIGYGYYIKWPDTGVVGEKELADIVSKVASANQSQRVAGGQMVMTHDEMRRRYLKLGPLPDEHKLPVNVNPTAAPISGEPAALPSGGEGDAKAA